MEPYEDLANAIIVKAAKDYRKSLQTLKKKPHPHSKKAINAVRMKSDCERFFKGEWIKTLTNLDGETLMKEIRKNL